MIRKALAWLLTLMMVVSILPMSVFATEEANAQADEPDVIKNIEVTDAEDNVTYYAGFTGFSELDLANCTIKLLADVSDANLILNKGDINVVLDLNGFTFSRTGSSSGLISLTQSAKLTICDSSNAKTGKILADTYAVWILNGDLVLESGTIETTSTTNVAIYANASDTIIKGGKIISAGNAISIGENFVESKGASNIRISGGKIVATDDCIIKGSYYVVGETTVTITGGTFSSDVSDYVADGYELDENGNVVVAAPAYVAYIGEQGFETVQAAINAAQSGDTVVIAAGEFGAINISNKNITIQGTVGADGELLTTIKGGDPAITGHGFNGTIKDLKIVDAWKVMYAEPAGNVTVDNVYVTGATYGFHLIAYSEGLTWTIQNSYMDLSWANSFGVYGGDAAIVIKGNEFASTNPYYPEYGALAVNTFMPTLTVEDNIFGNGAKIYIDGSVTDTSNVTIGANYWADGYEKAFADDTDGVTVDITTYYSALNADGTINRDSITTVTYAAQIGTVGYTSLQAAIDAVQNGETITLLADVTENVTLTEAVGLYYTIDGNGKTMNGNITITPLSDTNDNRRITINNVNFVTEADKLDFISASNTNHYPRLTVTNCDFTGTGADSNVVAIRVKSADDLVIEGCTAKNVHSLLQNDRGGWNYTIKNCTVTNAGRGMSLNSVQGALIENVTINAANDKYGIRLDGENNNNTITIKDCTISAFIPVVVRNAQVENYTVIFNGTNTMTATNTDGYWCAIGTSEYETNGSLPTAPTGKVTVTLNDTGLDMTGVYGNYVEPPKGAITIGYTSETGVWGEASNANAKVSYVVELYINDEKIAASTLAAKYMTGEQKLITWSIPFAGQNNEDWVTVWEEGHPNKNESPTTVKLVIDGEVVSTNVVQMNGPDGLWPVVWEDLEALQPVAVAQIGDTKYYTIAEAIKNASASDTVVLIANATENITIANGATVTLDLNGKTLNGYIVPCTPASLTITNGSIVNNNSAYSAIEINAGTLTLTDVNVSSARHGVRIDGAVTATINGGEYKLTATSGTRHAVNVSGGATVTIKDGTFVGPRGTDMDSGSAVCVQTGATVTIEGGNFSLGKNATLGVSGTLTITGGTFDQDPSAYVAEGYATVEKNDGKFMVGKLPNAEVVDLGKLTIEEYTIYNGSLSEGEEPINLQVALEFLAKDTEEEAAANAFANYTTDFYITISDLSSNTITLDEDCYLAGNYGTFGWIMIPLEGLEIVDDNIYPVITSVGFDFKYVDICTSVKDFKCGIHLSDAVLAANADLEVKLELGLSETIDEAKNGNFVVVDDAFVYDVDDLAPKTYVAQIDTTKYETLEAALKALKDGDTLTLLDNVTVDGTWDCRNTGAKITASNVTINGNGKTLKLTGNVDDRNWNTVFRFEGDNAKVENLKIDVSGATGVQRVISSKLSIEVNSCTITGNGTTKYGVIFGEGAGAAISDVTAKIIATNFNNFVRGVSDNANGQDAKSVEIAGNCRFINADVYVSASETVTFTGNTVTNGYVDIRSYTANNALNVTATGNTLTENTNTAYNYIQAGGTVNAQDNFLTPVAKIGGNYYVTLAQAFDKANSGETVVLLKDIALDATITVAKNVTLDLNGKTITGTCGTDETHMFMVNNAVTMTIKDSSTEQNGKITYAGNNSTGWIVDVEGALVLESGTLELTGTWSIGYAVDVRPNAWGTAYTAATSFTMKGGKIVSSDGAVRVASSSVDTYTNISASFTMYGGEIDAAWDGIFVQQGNAAWDVLNVTINNGTIKSDLNPIRLYGPAATSYVNGEDCGTIALNGGTLTYTGTEAREWLVDGILRVGGGADADDFLKSFAVTASEAFAETNVADGYKWVANADGTYTLATATYVVAIDGVGYESLASAIANATAGDTITFLADITEDVTITKAVTIDGANKTYTGNMTLKADTTIKNVNFDGKGYNGYAVETRGANYLTIEDCTAKNYGWGFVQLASGTALTTVKNVTISDMAYGVKVDYSKAVVLENVEITASVAAVLNSNHGEKTITIKDSDISILGTWGRDNTIETTYVFEGENSIDEFIINADLDNFKLAEGATLTAPNDITVTTDVPCGAVKYENGTYFVEAGLSGSGTEEDPYLITNLDELKLFRDSVNAGKTKYNAPDVYVALGKDIDLSSVENWVGIGSVTQEHGFMGNFDGKNFKIMNLTISNPALDSYGYAYAGLFSITEGTANSHNVIKNLTIENVTISTTGDIVAAAIAYPFYTTVENVKVCGKINITGGNYTAGALAYTRRCVNASNVTVEGTTGSTITGATTVGGVISDIQMNGELTANYSNFSVSGVTITGTTNVGGISGIICNQALNGATVKNVTLVCSDARVGTVAGAHGGDFATITSVTVENVTGATTVIGATYDGAKTVEAKIGDTYYATLEAALAAAEAGDTITLFVPVVVAAGETLTLDKAVTIEYTSDVPGEDMITNRGTLVIDGATLVYTNTDTTASNVTVSTISCEPGSVLEVKRGTVKNDSENNAAGGIYAYAIDLLTNGSLGDVTATISGGNVISTNYMAIRQFNNGTACKNTLTVTGGEIYGAKRAIQVHFDNNAAYLTISNGKVVAGEGGYALCLFPTDATHISVTGGEFIGTVYSGTAGFISGGTYTVEPDAAYAAEGYKFVQNENDTYGVVEDPAYGKAAYIETTGVYYDTFDAAYNAANKGDTIVLLETAVIDKMMANYNKKTVTIKANGLETAFLVTDDVMMGTFAGMTVETDGICFTFGEDANGYGPTVDITGGTYKGGTSAIKVVAGLVRIANGTFSATGEKTIDATAKQVNANGGKYDFDPTAYIPANRVAQKGSDGYWTVAEAVAQIGEVKYIDLASAISAAKAGETVTLLRDINLGDIGAAEAIMINRNITIDGEGYWTITVNSLTDNWYNAVFAGNASAYTVKNLTIKLNNASEYAAFSMKRGGTLENVTVEGAFAKGVDVSLANALTVTNCTFDGTTVGVNAPYSYAPYSTVTITGTTFNTTGAAAVLKEGAVFTENIIAANSYVQASDYVDVSKNFWNGNNTTGEAPAVTQLVGDEIVCDSYYATNTNGVLSDLTPIGEPEEAVIEVVVGDTTYAYGLSKLALVADLIGSNTAEGATIKLLADVTMDIEVAAYGAFDANDKWTVTPKTVKIDLNGKTLNGFIGINAGVTATITNGTVNNTNNHPAIDVTGTATVENMTVKSTATKAFRTAEGATLTVKTGTYSSDPTAYVPEGYVVEEANGTYVVRLANYVVAIGDDKFESLQAAVNAAQDGDVIKFIDNFVIDGATTINEKQFGYETLVYVDGKKITIDFNGYTATVTPTATDVPDGFANTIEAVIFIGNGGELTLKDSTTDAKGGFKVNKGTTDLYSLIYNCEASLVIVNGNYYVEETIESGSLIYADAPQTTEIRGGTFTLGNASENVDSTKPWIFNAEGKNASFIDVKGGTYNQNILMNYGTAKDCEARVPNTMAVKDNGDGTWTIVDAVAFIGDANGYNRGFATLAEAVAVGGDVTLLGDIHLTETLVVDKAITINGNSKKITGDDDLIQFNADVTLNNVVMIAGKYDYALVIKDSDITVTLNDCTVTGPFKCFGTSEYIINSGTYMKGNSVYSSMLNGAVVYGGTFHYEILAQYVAPGYVVVDNGDGTWTVKYDPACFIDADNDGVMDEGEAVYGSLEALFAENLSGEVTVVLLKDVSTDEVVDTAADTTYNFVTYVDGGVTMDWNYADNWNYIQKASIGENITLNVRNLVAWTDFDIHGTVNAYYPYFTGADVTVHEGATLSYEGGDALQVKNGATLTVYGTVTAPTINVWVGASKLVVSGENAVVNASWIDIWDGTPSVTVEDGATLDVTKIKASRGGSITVNDATLTSESIELGHNGDSIGTLTVTGDSTVSEIKLTVVGSTVTGPEGLTVTSGVDGYEVKYANGVYSLVEKVVEPVVELSAIEAAYDAEVQLWMYFIIPNELINDDSAYVSVVKSGAWEDVETIITMAELRKVGPTSHGDYKIIQGIASGEMGKNVTVKFVDGNGNVVKIKDYVDNSVNDAVTRSIVDYAKRVFTNGTEKQKKMVVGLLTYGGYAQLKFGVDANNPVYNILTEYGYEIPTLEDISASSITQEMTISGSNAGINFTAQEAYFDSAIYHRVFFKLDANESISNFKFEVSMIDVNGNTYVQEVYAQYDSRYDEYYIDILDIPAAYLDYMYKITVTNTSTSETYEVTTSVLVWAKLVIEKSADVKQINLAKAAYYYNAAANVFFEK